MARSVDFFRRGNNDDNLTDAFGKHNQYNIWAIDQSFVVLCFYSIVCRQITV